MKMLTVSWLLMVSAGSVLSDGNTDEDSLLSPCNMTDIECLSESTTRFLEKTYKGDSKYGFVAIDPVRIPSSKVDFGDGVGLNYKYKNILVRGLKHQTIFDFIMDTATKSVVLTTKADLNIAGDVDVEFPKKTKNFAGSWTAKGSVLVTAIYNYELMNNDKSVQHFEVGPEIITCQIVSAPEAQLNPELIQAVSQDDDFKNISKEIIEDLRSETFCEIVKEAYKPVIHNLRAAAKLLPASAFFTDI